MVECHFSFSQVGNHILSSKQLRCNDHFNVDFSIDDHYHNHCIELSMLIGCLYTWCSLELSMLVGCWCSFGKYCQVVFCVYERKRFEMAALPSKVFRVGEDLKEQLCCCS